MNKKLPWQHRYEHFRDMQKAQCTSRGIPVPPEEYGVIRTIPGLNRAFKGKEFWAAFKEMGHTSTVYENCGCQQ